MRNPSGQQLEPVGGVDGDASEYIGEPDLRIDIVHLRRDDEAIAQKNPRRRSARIFSELPYVGSAKLLYQPKRKVALRR